jgi:2Fe-2S ferredoxin
MLITIHVEQPTGEVHAIEVPTDISLSLMEILKASDYPVEAACGGMALCATCHIEVLEGEVHREPTDAELDMLDTLPNATTNSRLACQIPITPSLEGLTIRLVGA